MKIVILIRSLDIGGAERQAVALARALHQRQHTVTVMVFYPGGEMTGTLETAGVSVISLDKKGRWDLIPFIWRLVRQIRTSQADVVQSYLSVANTLSVLIKPFIGRRQVIWGIRAADIDLSHYNWLFSLTWWIERHLACCADKIIVNSRAGQVYALKNGFPERAMVVIPNGIDSARFIVNRAAGLRLRREWGVAEDTVLIGLIGRLDPIKGHGLFIRAAAALLKKAPEVRFICVGGSSGAYYQEHKQLAEQLGITTQLLWVDVTEDMVSLYNALDCLTNCSQSEGFSNVIGEAMACAVPCVVTDVGDSSWLVGSGGIVVPPNQPAALCDAWRELLADQQQRVDLGERGRQRVVAEFSVARLLEQTEQVYRQ